MNSALNELSKSDTLIEEYTTKFKYYPLAQSVTLLKLLYDMACHVDEKRSSLCSD